MLRFLCAMYLCENVFNSFSSLTKTSESWHHLCHLVSLAVVTIHISIVIWSKLRIKKLSATILFFNCNVMWKNMCWYGNCGVSIRNGILNLPWLLLYVKSLHYHASFADNFMHFCFQKIIFCNYCAHRNICIPVYSHISRHRESIWPH